MDEPANLLNRTADIVAAYITRNPLPASDLGGLIKSVHASLSQGKTSPVDATPEVKAPAVSIKKSITPDYLVCLEDGLKFKSLKRHLLSKYGMSPDDYRAKWGLQKDYPMVAPAYSASRSALAKKMNLGIKPGARPKAKSPAKI